MMRVIGLPPYKVPAKMREHIFARETQGFFGTNPRFIGLRPESSVLFLGVCGADSHYALRIFVVIEASGVSGFLSYAQWEARRKHLAPWAQQLKVRSLHNGDALEITREQFDTLPLLV